jgi:hypothetical protein
LFGAEWAIENLIPSIVEIREHKSYLRRLTALQACGMMATEMDPDSATLEVLPLILDMATDGVSSIIPNFLFILKITNAKNFFKLFRFLTYASTLQANYIQWHLFVAYRLTSRKLSRYLIC